MDLTVLVTFNCEQRAPSLESIRYVLFAHYGIPLKVEQYPDKVWMGTSPPTMEQERPLKNYIVQHYKHLHVATVIQATNIYHAANKAQQLFGPIVRTVPVSPYKINTLDPLLLSQAAFRKVIAILSPKEETNDFDPLTGR